MTASQPDIAFTITRSFPGLSRERMWRAWCEAGELRHWWGPKGCAVEVLSLAFRPGGFFHYAMKFEGAPTMWGRFNYREIEAPRRLVWLNSFSNEDGGITRAPFSEVCPLEILNTVNFTEQGGGTALVLRAEPFGATVAERRFFEELHPSLEQGYGGTLDQLAQHLAARP